MAVMSAERLLGSSNGGLLVGDLPPGFEERNLNERDIQADWSGLTLSEIMLRGFSDLATALPPGLKSANLNERDIRADCSGMTLSEIMPERLFGSGNGGP